MTTYKCHVCDMRSWGDFDSHMLIDLDYFYTSLTTLLGLGWTNTSCKADWVIELRHTTDPSKQAQRVKKVQYFRYYSFATPWKYEWWFDPNAHPYQFNCFSDMAVRIDELLNKFLFS